MATPSLDPDDVRRHFPALADGLARFDGPGGSLVPTPVAQAVAGAMTSGMCQRDGFSGPGRRTEQVTADARAALGRIPADERAELARLLRRFVDG